MKIKINVIRTTWSDGDIAEHLVVDPIELNGRIIEGLAIKPPKWSHSAVCPAHGELLEFKRELLKNWVEVDFDLNKYKLSWRGCDNSVDALIYRAFDELKAFAA